VAFYALIPCMLFTKVGATLAARPDPALLAIPLVAATQACCAPLNIRPDVHRF